MELTERQEQIKATLYAHQTSKSWLCYDVEYKWSIWSQIPIWDNICETANIAEVDIIALYSFGYIKHYNIKSIEEFKMQIALNTFPHNGYEKTEALWERELIQRRHKCHD